MASIADGWLSPCLKLNRTFEGCEKKRPDGLVEAYPDPATGGAPWTVGWGSTGPDIHRNTIWSQSQCDTRLLLDLTDKYGPAVDKLCEGIEITPNQKAALVSFARNVGLHNLEESTLLRKFRDGNVQGAADEFLKWHFAAHKSLPGLIKRREAEREMFLS